MSVDDLPLGDALAAAMERAQSEPPREPPADADIEALVQAAALAFGLQPDKVVADFRKGGALADLIRAAFDGAPKVKGSRGRPRDEVGSWLAFIQVIHLVRQGHSLEEAWARCADDMNLTDSAVRSRYERVRDRDKVSPDSVPASPLVAIFADPRPQSTAQKSKRISAVRRRSD